MRSVTLTGSSLWRAARCIGSAVLPRAPETTPWSERGTSGHAFLEDVSRIGREAALAAVKNEKERAALALIDTGRLPVDPTAYAAEVAFAYDVATGRARVLGQGLRRQYGTLSPSEIPLTMDVVALVSDDAVYVGDYKLGYQFLEPPAQNWQFRAGGLAAARAYHRERAIVEMIRIGGNGDPYMTTDELDLFQLAEIAEELRELHADATRAAAADVEPPVHPGSHCAGCPSIPYCHASTSLIRAASRDPEAIVVGVAAELTAEHALEAYEQIEALEILVRKLRKQLDDYARFQPIALRDGRFYGPVENHRDKLDGDKVFEYLEERYGAEEAWKVVELTATKKALEELCGRLCEADKQNGGKMKRTPLLRSMLDDLRLLCAVTTNHWESVEEYKPKGRNP
jgi:PD-(D/E)XK nuclease superfamily